MKIKKIFANDDGGTISREFEIKCRDAIELKEIIGPKLYVSCYSYYFYNDFTEKWTKMA